MAKNRLKALDGYRFQYDTIVKVRDLNYGGHLGNDAVVALLQEARLDLLRSLGCSELDLGDGETGLIMSELTVNYRAESFMFDPLSIFSELSEVKSASFRLAHRVSRDDTTIALAEVGLVAFNYQTRRIADIPESFLAKIG